ncbi:hypothetical protein L1887_23157 [Cichorium endivia]|nr:hypothetical protein L1887_23153 [Cichorium endivia]KAI3508153.1 hypothetical protein L1887_23157 [Cichorium endivia]
MPVTETTYSHQKYPTHNGIGGPDENYGNGRWQSQTKRGTLLQSKQEVARSRQQQGHEAKKLNAAYIEGSIRRAHVSSALQTKQRWHLDDNHRNVNTRRRTNAKMLNGSRNKAKEKRTLLLEEGEAKRRAKLRLLRPSSLLISK